MTFCFIIYKTCYCLILGDDLNSARGNLIVTCGCSVPLKCTAFGARVWWKLGLLLCRHEHEMERACKIFMFAPLTSLLEFIAVLLPIHESEEKGHLTICISAMLK